MTERIHPTQVEGHDLVALATEVGRLRYDALALFLQALTNELERQSEADNARNRVVLAGMLDRAATVLDLARHEIVRAFKLSAPHMREELGQNPSLLP